ncbi:hypothetical protein FUA23_17800 [Neolewinella aurantiaca]|uniref:Uncharacterized protein n=1 Tax=Neolewinella aurantiaca TaxID=2602767 RepID=A0A5C7FSJ6_9BACT|nr:hypothetical protein [Neolewinella aurantiaca]TXF87665.1 hypothetical protein FUA23_17800 [Neolewinella aurantiaca]
MKATIVTIMLTMLLLAQAGRTSLMLQWQTLANESFTALFCVNNDWETDVPMCAGSCQLPELFQEMTSGEGGDEFSASFPSTTSPYCQLPVRITPLQPVLPAVLTVPAPATVPFYTPGDYVGSVFEPPAMG